MSKRAELYWRSKNVSFVRLLRVLWKGFFRALFGEISIITRTLKQAA